MYQLCTCFVSWQANTKKKVIFSEYQLSFIFIQEFITVLRFTSVKMTTAWHFVYNQTIINMTLSNESEIKVDCFSILDQR